MSVSSLLPLFLLPLLAGVQGADDHVPIDIRSDTDLASPDVLGRNGVRSGSGTADDPYVISHWRIRTDGVVPGIRIQDTTVHVRIHNITIEHGEGSVTAALFLARSHDIEVRDVVLSGRPADLWVHAIDTLHAERVIIPNGSLGLHETDQATLVRNQLGAGAIQGVVAGPTTVRANVVASAPGSLGSAIDVTALIEPGLTVTVVVDQNRVDSSEGHGILVRSASQARVCDNLVRDVAGAGIYLLGAHGEAEDRGAEVCGNRVERAGGEALFASNATALDVHNNTFTESRRGFSFLAIDGSVRDNFLTANDVGLAFLLDSHDGFPSVRHNVFLANEVAATSWTSLSGPFDLRENYWGTTADPGSAATNFVEGDILYAPWCLDPSCTDLSEPDARAAGIQSGAALLAIATAALLSGSRLQNT